MSERLTDAELAKLPCERPPSCTKDRPPCDCERCQARRRYFAQAFQHVIKPLELPKRWWRR